MKIHVLFFAQLKDRLGTGEREIKVEEGVTAGELAQQFMRKMVLENSESLPIRYAVNEAFVSGDEPLKDQDRLALIPPVAGG